MYFSPPLRLLIAILLMLYLPRNLQIFSGIVFLIISSRKNTTIGQIKAIRDTSTAQWLHMHLVNQWINMQNSSDRPNCSLVIPPSISSFKLKILYPSPNGKIFVLGMDLQKCTEEGFLRQPWAGDARIVCVCVCVYLCVCGVCVRHGKEHSASQKAAGWGGGYSWSGGWCSSTLSVPVPQKPYAGDGSTSDHECSSSCDGRNGEQVWVLSVCQAFLLALYMRSPF